MANQTARADISLIQGTERDCSLKCSAPKWLRLLTVLCMSFRPNHLTCGEVA
jgi:hypothetical protein